MQSFKVSALVAAGRPVKAAARRQAAGALKLIRCGGIKAAREAGWLHDTHGLDLATKCMQIDSCTHLQPTARRGPLLV